MSRRIDIGLVLALAWLFTAAGVTLVFGPLLGLRGWAWLGVHHVVCLVGCTHEIRRAWRRRRARLAERSVQAASAEGRR